VNGGAYDKLGDVNGREKKKEEGKTVRPTRSSKKQGAERVRVCGSSKASLEMVKGTSVGQGGINH